MKKIVHMTLVGCSIFLFSLVLYGCMQAVSTPGGYVYVEGWFSYPVIYLTDGGSNFSNPNSPVTGTALSNATVIVSNETTGVSTPAVWNASNGYYTPLTQLNHTAGQSVSLSITTTSESIRGAATVTPDPTYANLIPLTGTTVRLPFSITWEVTQGTYETTHTWIVISSSTSTNAAYNYQTVIPISQKSLQITNANISAESGYSISLFGVNVMSLTGAKSGSVVYVGGGNTLITTGITIEAQ